MACSEPAEDKPLSSSIAEGVESRVQLYLLFGSFIVFLGHILFIIASSIIQSM